MNDIESFYDWQEPYPPADDTPEEESPWEYPDPRMLDMEPCDFVGSLGTYHIASCGILHIYCVAGRFQARRIDGVLATEPASEFCTWEEVEEWAEGSLNAGVNTSPKPE